MLLTLLCGRVVEPASPQAPQQFLASHQMALRPHQMCPKCALGSRLTAGGWVQLEGGGLPFRPYPPTEGPGHLTACRVLWPQPLSLSSPPTQNPVLVHPLPHPCLLPADTAPPCPFALGLSSWRK